MNEETDKPPVVVPARHPAHYLMHKYWARKPHNLVAAYIEHHSSAGDIVLDPFSGSGVTAIESLRLGRRTVAVDLNPVSRLIVEATTVEIEERVLRDWMGRIAHELESLVRDSYSTECPDCGGDAVIAYCVWSASATCAECGHSVVARGADRIGRGYACQHCGASTRITSSASAEETMMDVVFTCAHCADKRVSKPAEAEDVRRAIEFKQAAPRWRPRDERFLPNRRTLVQEGQKTADFFTPRNFEVLAAIRAEIEEIPDDSVRRVMLLTFTASVAQASRLIAYRENMTTGGPAWSVPGFWVPPIHLELNAWEAFRNRFEKTLRGRSSAAQALQGTRLHEAASFEELRAGTVANALLLTQSSTSLDAIPDDSVDYIFADPPYGDAVPYLEFSALWLAWLNEDSNPDCEVVISDAPGRSKGLDRYEADLRSVFGECHRVLKPGGTMTVTFHNKSMDVWNAIAASLGDAGFVLSAATYCPPAVVSSKAQLAPEGSMVGDVVLNLVKAPLDREQPDATSSQMKVIIAAALERAICERGGCATAEEAIRAAVISLLKVGARGIDHGEYQQLLADRYEQLGSSWTLRPGENHLVAAYPQLEEEAARIAAESIDRGVNDKREIFANILDVLRDGSAPSLCLMESAYRQAETDRRSRLQLF